MSEIQVLTSENGYKIVCLDEMTFTKIRNAVSDAASHYLLNGEEERGKELKRLWLDLIDKDVSSKRDMIK